MQLISWKKNNPLKKKTQRGHNTPEKNTSILCLTDSILSSQRVRALSPETTVTETRAFEASISEISSNVDLQQQSTLFNFCGKWESRMSFQRSLSSRLLFIINPHVLLLCLDTNRLALFRNVPSVWGKSDPK